MYNNNCSCVLSAERLGSAISCDSTQKLLLEMFLQIVRIRG
jgi:hypothetical protein